MLNNFKGFSLKFQMSAKVFCSLFTKKQLKKMTIENKISASLSVADKAEVLTKVSEIKAKLPFLLNLTNYRA
jgi:hypothetical protein